MPKFTIGIGVILCSVGLFGYFGSRFENPSMIALLSVLAGLVLIACGVMAQKADLRKHVMHVAALIGLIGFFGGGGLVYMNIPLFAGDDPTIDHRPIRMVGLMALVCLIYVITCIGSFILARLRRV